jgi:ABC-type phosphate transport system substrate-binding protein
MKNKSRLWGCARILTVMTVFLTLFSMKAIVYAEVVIVANPGVPEKTISKQDMEKIFTGKKSKWSDGSKVIPVVQNKSDGHEQFTLKYVSKSAAQFKAYWNKMIFTGEGKPPQSFDSNESLINFVSTTPGAIGYVTGGNEDKVMKIKVSD